MRAVTVFLVAALLVPTHAAAAGRPEANGAAAARETDRPAVIDRQGVTASEAALGRLLIALLEEGAGESIRHDHPLRPLGEVPSAATLTCLLFGNDSLRLAHLYPLLSNLVAMIFSPQYTTAAGFIAGERLGHGAVVCPGLNALAALELHSLSLIAAAVGNSHDAIELRDWSHRHADALRRHFYDPGSGIFRAPAGDDPFDSAILPDQLLPFFVGRRVGNRALCAALRRIREQGITPRPRSRGPSLWDDPAIRPMIISLLRGLDDPVCEDPVSLLAIASPPGAVQIDPSPQAEWIAFWNSASDAMRQLRPPSDDLFILTQLALILERENLVTGERLDTLAADLGFLTECLECETVDLGRHGAAIEAADRLLATVSTMSEALDSGQQIWKIFDERLWNRMSPRQRRITAEACHLVAADLAAAKRTLSARMMRTTGISASLNLPDRPVRAGEQVELEVTLGSMNSPLAVEMLVLRIAEKRWLLGGFDEPLPLVTASAPLRWTRKLTTAPGSAPGLFSLEACLEFFTGERRVEIHLIESSALTPKYDVALHFPLGRAIRDESLPVEIVLRHPPGERALGVVSGLFDGNFSCEPSLPAEFLIRAGTEMTILPLKITAKATVGPGRHPFALSVTLGDAPLAVFNDSLLRPMGWLHLGPLPQGDWLARKAVDLSGSLAAEHVLPDGGSARWLEVPAAALDATGAVRPARLYGPLPERGMLLYAAVTQPRQSSVRWSLTGDCPATLWINALPHAVGASADRTSTLRAGRNSILIAASWSEPCEGILLEILDEGGFPLAELSDATGAALRETALNLATFTDAASSPEQPREVTFTLAHPEAREVSLIGEFNGWAPDAAPMRPHGAGVWKASVFLTPGTYSYKFLIDRRHRIVDPRAATIEPDGFGGYNAVITVK